MRTWFAFVGLVLVSSPVAMATQPAPPPPPPPSLLMQLEGAWYGTGTILGQPARVEMQWQSALDGRFMRLTFVSHIGPEPNARRFEGHAYYLAPADAGRLRATWFDSSGLVRPIEAVVTADTLVATWGTSETEVGETTYRLTAPDTVEIIDRVRGKNGVWREFGRSRLSRTIAAHE